jgi:hypothetical protein
MTKLLADEKKIIYELKYSTFSFKKKQITRDTFESSPFGPPGSRLGNSYYSAIGEFIVAFAELEGSISTWNIPQLLANKFDDGPGFNYKIGHSIVAKMQAIDKFNLLVELLIAYEVDDMFVKDFVITKTQLNQFRKMLICAAEARNIVAHADWAESLEDYWYVTKLSHNKETGLYDYVLHQLSEEELRNATEYVRMILDEVTYILEFMKIRVRKAS